MRYSESRFSPTLINSNWETNAKSSSFKRVVYENTHTKKKNLTLTFPASFCLFEDPRFVRLGWSSSAAAAVRAGFSPNPGSLHNNSWSSLILFLLKTKNCNYLNRLAVSLAKLCIQNKMSSTLLTTPLHSYQQFLITCSIYIGNGTLKSSKKELANACMSGVCFNMHTNITCGKESGRSTLHHC